MTLRVGIAGLRGRMGREIARLVGNDVDLTLVGGLGRRSGGDPSVLTDAAELLPDIDVLIDFTSPEAAGANAEACATLGKPLVSGTTGLDAAQAAAVHGAATSVAVFQAANMSLGVNAMLSVLPTLVRALGGYDIEIVETHHRHKVDAPSGTALALARVAADASGHPLSERARHGREGAALRMPDEIGIHAVRAGGNPGEHAVILTGDGEEIRLTHRSFSRASYAEGALKAARLIVGQPPGWYEPATLPGFL